METRGEKFQIPYRDILYFEVSLRTVSLHYDSQILQFSDSIKSLKKKVQKKGFVQISRSFLLNVKNVDEIGKNKVKLMNGEVLPLSPRYFLEIQEAFKCFLYEEE